MDKNPENIKDKEKLAQAARIATAVPPKAQGFIDELAELRAGRGNRIPKVDPKAFEETN